MNYKECKELAITNDIKSANQWFKFTKGKDIPTHPERKFKNEWVSWFDFLGKNKNQRKYKVNDDFFKKIDRQSSYILGLWAADGHVRRNQFSLTQNKKDIYIMEQILKVMESNNPLNNHYSNNIYFNIYSNEIVSDLKKIFGNFNNKTFDLNFPKIEDKYLSDFIRGFFDGDGCITYQKNEKCYTSSIISVSEKFINKLFKILKSEIKDFNGKLKLNNGYYLIVMGVNDTRRFGKYIYKDLTNDNNTLYLKRKKEKFEKSGDIKIATFNKKFLTYNESKIYIKNLEIKTYRSWRIYKKNNEVDIPSNMDYYDEYTNWKDFIS
jgi:hypothetical protein